MMNSEIAVGMAMPSRTFTIELWPMKVFTLIMDDPNPIHFDPQFVRQLGRGDKAINQGTLNIAYPLNVLFEWLGGSNPSSTLVSFSCRFASSVYEDDEVTVGGEVASVNDDGTASITLWLDRQNGDRALSGVAVVLLEGTPQVRRDV